MIPVHLVMPMAGRGSRFDRAGYALPKPLVPLAGHPFFAWAVESVRRSLPVASLTAVILAEHVRQHRLDARILARYPEARLVVLPDTTPGALVTAVLGCRDLPDTGAVLVNDCDHAFVADSLAAALPGLMRDADGFLCHFRSRDPAYSYAEYDPGGRLLRTVEKRPVGDLAIAGAYGFADRAALLRHVADYRRDCPYDEPFMSGLYNHVVAAGGTVRGALLDRHLSFGTPAEHALAEAGLARSPLGAPPPELAA